MTYNPKIAERANDVSVRQTVLSGPPNFIQPGNGLECSLLASTPINVTFADGQDNYVETITDSVAAWSGLTANATNFLYVERNPTTGALTYGSVADHAPFYADRFNGVTKSLLHFNGNDASTTIIDQNSDFTWSTVNQAQLDTADKKFGKSSALFDGSADRIQSSGGFTMTAGSGTGGFKIDMWFKLNTADTHWLFNATTNFHIGLRINTSHIPAIFLGNGGSWSIANNVTGTALTTGIWYHFRLQWDESTYKVYINGDEWMSVTSSTAFASTSNEFRIGNDQGGSADGINGWIDEFRYEIGPQTLGTFTAPTVPFNDIIVDDEHWFDMVNFKMKYWDDTNVEWVEVQRVFLGEGETDGSEVTSVVTYAINGENSHEQDFLTTNTVYIKNHNIGTNQLEYETWFECRVNIDGYIRGDRINLDGDYSSGARESSVTWDRNTVTFLAGNSFIGILNPKSGGVGVLMSPAPEWGWKIHIKRMGF